jgi:hypothetical protein
VAGKNTIPPPAALAAAIAKLIAVVSSVTPSPAAPNAESFTLKKIPARAANAELRLVGVEPIRTFQSKVPAESFHLFNTAPRVIGWLAAVGEPV